MFTMSLSKPDFHDFKSYVYTDLTQLLGQLISSHGCAHQGQVTEVEEAGEETGWNETRGIGSYIIHYRGDEQYIGKDIVRRRPFWRR